MKFKTTIERLQKIKKLPALDKYCIFSFTVLISYTITEQIISSITGTTNDTLTTCLFGAFGGELLLLAMIKRLKIQKEGSE